MAWNGSARSEATARHVRKEWRVPWGTVAVVLAIVVGIIAVARFVISSSSPQSAVETHAKGKIKSNPGRYAQTPQEAVRRAMPANVKAEKKKARRRPSGSADLFADFKGEDRKLAEKMQAALDADDLRATVRSAQAALRSENPELRMNAVNALGWFGVAALPELTGCMADLDENVRQTAGNHWELAVQNVENPSDRLGIVAAAFATLSDEAVLTSLGGILRGTALEMIDGAENAESAAQNRLTVLQTLVDIIESGQEENAMAAKEAYNDITGNEWLGIEEADRYLADPDNYDPDGPSADEEMQEATDDGTTVQDP